MSERTAQEWADYIMAAINAANADGVPVSMCNNCCNCSDITLDVGEYGQIVELRF